MCTSLSYRDAQGNVYFGRTLELTIDLPYQVVYFPAGFAMTSHIAGHPPLDYVAQHRFVAIAMPARIPTRETPITIADLKALEGVNDAGLTFSLLSYPAAAGTGQSLAVTRAVLSASDLGTWALGQFATVAEVKSAIEAQPVLLEPLAMLGGAVSPFHYVVHDASGASIVIEFHRGEMAIYDNPVGVMTNGPQFDWHLTNLNSYTFLTNVDKSSAAFGGYKAVQPDSGIATAGLPASNTSVGRFVRAAFYAEYTEKAGTPDEAVLALAHIMNNFDRPRGLTIDYPDAGGGHLEVEGLDAGAAGAYATEFTSWTSLADLDRKLFFVRDYQALNFTCFNLEALANVQTPKAVRLDRFSGMATDATDALRTLKAA